MPKKILVTGGAGYIGSHTVVELLQNKIEVVNIDNFSNAEPFILNNIQKITSRSHQFVEATLGNAGDDTKILNALKGVDTVIHFAAFKSVSESMQSPYKYYKNNVDGLLSLIRIMEKAGVRNLVFSSSCTVYGQPKALPVTEKSPFLPAQSVYGSTKQVCEQILKDVAHLTKKLNVIVLRYFNPIGAHSSGLLGELPKGVPNNLIPFITQTAARRRNTLQVFGNDYNTPDGTCIRDYLHVCDLAEAHLAACNYLNPQKEKSNYAVFNLGTGKGVSVLEAIKAFEAATNIKLNWQFSARRPGDVAKIYADSTKANIELPWECKKTLQQAMADAWRWEQLNSCQ